MVMTFHRKRYIVVNQHDHHVMDQRVKDPTLQVGDHIVNDLEGAHAQCAQPTEILELLGPDQSVRKAQGWNTLTPRIIPLITKMSALKVF